MRTVQQHAASCLLLYEGVGETARCHPLTSLILGPQSEMRQECMELAQAAEFPWAERRHVKLRACMQLTPITDTRIERKHAQLHRAIRLAPGTAAPSCP